MRQGGTRSLAGPARIEGCEVRCAQILLACLDTVPFVYRIWPPRGFTRCLLYRMRSSEVTCL